MLSYKFDTYNGGGGGDTSLEDLARIIPVANLSIKFGDKQTNIPLRKGIVGLFFLSKGGA